MNSSLRGVLIRFGIVPHDGVETLRHRTFKGTSWAIFGAAISQGLGFLCMLIVARILNPELFGEFSTIRTTTAMFGIFAGFGLGYTASKHIAQYRSIDPLRAGRIWGLVDVTASFSSLIICGVIYVFSSYIAEHIMKASHLAPLLRISAAIVFFNTIIWVQNFILGGLEAFKHIAVIEITRGVLYFPILIAASYFWGVKGAVVGLCLVSMGGFIVSKIILSRETGRQSIRIDRIGGLKEASIILNYTLPAFLSSITVIVGQWVSTAMLVRQAGGMTQNGLFSAANQFPEIIAFLPMTLGNPMVSILSNLYGQGQYRQFKKLVLFNIGSIGCLTVVMSGMILLLSPYLISVYGDSYSSAVILLRIGCVAVVFRCFSRMTTQVLMSMGKVKVEFVFGIIQTLSLLTLWYFQIGRAHV